MKILATSDWHADWSTAGLPRFGDVQAAVDETVAAALERRVDLYLFLGDLANPTVRSHRAIEFALTIARRLASDGVASRWLVGNHDVIEDGSGTSTLSAMHGASWAPPSFRRGDEMFRTYDRPMVERFGDVLLVALPFTPLSEAYEPERFVRSVAGQAADARRVVVAGHLNLEGIKSGSETEDMPRGRSVFFPTDACREVFGKKLVMLNGHYHEGQNHDGVIIPGSLERLTRSEVGNVPGFVVVDT